MPRIAGIDLKEKANIPFALTAIYGIGRNNVVGVLKKADVSADKRIHELSEAELARLQKTIETSVKVEGDLRREINDNIKRLQTIGSYRGRRHSQGLPSRGQRTKTNARTKRGKRKTVGALKKEDQTKVGIPEA